MAPPVDGTALKRLLRHHPKLHPESTAALEYRRLGLSELPFLDWEDAKPWGRLLEDEAAGPDSAEKDDAEATTDGQQSPPQHHHLQQAPEPLAAGSYLSPPLRPAPSTSPAVAAAIEEADEAPIIFGLGPKPPPRHNLTHSLASIQAEEAELFRRMQELARRRALVADAALKGVSQVPDIRPGEAGGASSPAGVAMKRSPELDDPGIVPQHSYLQEQKQQQQQAPAPMPQHPSPHQASPPQRHLQQHHENEAVLMMSERDMSLDLSAVDAEEAALLEELGGLEKQLHSAAGGAGVAIGGTPGNAEASPNLPSNAGQAAARPPRPAG